MEQFKFPLQKMLLLILAFAFTACTSNVKNEGEASFKVPVDYYKLDNGLRVVLSEDHTAPTVVVAVYYNIGFRIEPKDRTGFAHLFEHMMFQGSENLPKGEFDKLIERNGGLSNGSTRFDFTNYFEIMPAHMLEPILWAEADRMIGLSINQDALTNQKGVVISEVNVNVINQPYGGFPWLDMPQLAFENWYNAHNFYGDFKDLEAAKIEDVDSFFKTYYSPGNAVLAIVGDFKNDEAKEFVQKHFGSIPGVELPAKPDISEPVQIKEKRFTKEDKLANKPAIAIAYKMPERNTPEYYALGLIDQVMLQGEDSKLHQKLVQSKGYTGNVSGGVNYQLGNMYNYNGPMLWMIDLIYDSNISPDSIINEVDNAISELDNITQKDLDLALVKVRSSLYDEFGSFFGVGRAEIMACFAMFDDDPSRINNLEAEFKKVTVEMIKKTGREYLRPTNRTILVINPKSVNP